MEIPQLSQYRRLVKRQDYSRIFDLFWEQRDKSNTVFEEPELISFYVTMAAQQLKYMVLDHPQDLELKHLYTLETLFYIADKKDALFN